MEKSKAQCSSCCIKSAAFRRSMTIAPDLQRCEAGIAALISQDLPGTGLLDERSSSCDPECFRSLHRRELSVGKNVISIDRTEHRFLNCKVKTAVRNLHKPCVSRSEVSDVQVMI